MNRFFEYIKYRLNAKRRHGIHSPFMYELTDQCLRIKMDSADRKKLKEITLSYGMDERRIQIEDHGVGSKKMGQHRKVMNILQTSSSKGKYGKLLYQLARYYKPSRLLEFGTSLGIGTQHLFYGYPEGEIFSVEACARTRNVAREQLPQAIHSYHSTFSEFLKGEASGIYDLIFIDGHHDGEATISYVESLLDHSNEETIFLLDDIRWSDSMLEAWNELRAREEFHVSIDLFRMGILIRRPSQRKEHFTIRL